MLCVLDFVKIRRSVLEFRYAGDGQTDRQERLYCGYLPFDQKWFAVSFLLDLYTESETKNVVMSPSGALNQERTWR
jgi:hypothetical protein